MDVQTYAMARKYVNDTANSLGAVKGSPCTISSIVEESDGSIITFSWTGEDGTKETQSLKIPYGISETDKAGLIADLQKYIDEQVSVVEPDSIDDGEI